RTGGSLGAGRAGAAGIPAPEPGASGMSGVFDLVIVGCGPVGAYAANLFGRAGLKTLVLEREESPYSVPRAIHVDHEVMRLLGAVELLEPLADRLRAADGHLHIGADRGVIRQ